MTAKDYIFLQNIMHTENTQIQTEQGGGSQQQDLLLEVVDLKKGAGSEMRWDPNLIPGEREGEGLLLGGW